MRCREGVRCRLFGEVVSSDECGPDDASLAPICVGVGVGHFPQEALALALKSYFARINAAIAAAEL